MQWQHFLFLFGNKHLVIVGYFSWKMIFPKIEMDFWMSIWWHTYIVERLIFFCFRICGLANKQGSKHWRYFLMNRLKKKHHLNVNVRKWRSKFMKCIVCESLKDLISKLGNNSNEVLEYETKFLKHILHHESRKNVYHTWRTKSVWSKDEFLCIIHDKMDHTKTAFPRL